MTSREDGGEVKIGEAVISSANVAAGQTAQWETVGSIAGTPSSFTCRLADVQRFAS